MNEWIVFTIFLMAGLGMLFGGIYYRMKHAGDHESVSIFRMFTLIGA